MKNFASSLLQLWKQLGLNQRVSLVVAAAAVAAGLAGVVIWSQRPDLQLLYARLSEKDTAFVVSHLQSQGIPYRLAAGGSTVLVPATSVHRLRMDLAGKGVPSGEGVGFEIFDKSQFGLSDFMQRTNYLRAVQGELSRTIMQLHGVRAARVMIVQPESRLLLTEQGVKSTASVFVDVGGGRLEADQVNAIRHLVANAVQGLGPDQVVVVDNRGRTLSEDLKQDPMLGSANSQIRYRQQVEEYLARKVETMLATVIGQGNAVVRVSAEIDTEASTLVSEKYDPESQVVRSQTQTDDTTNSSEARSTGGATGVSANVPDKAQGAAEARPVNVSEQNRKNKVVTYEINKVTTNTTRSPGLLRSVTAAVFIAPRIIPGAVGADGKAAAPQPQPRTPQELDALRRVVVNALGVKATPGQSLDALVSLQEVPFHAGEITPGIIAAATDDSRIQTWMDLARQWLPVAAGLLMLFVFWRMLAREKPEAVPVEILSAPVDAQARARTAPASVTPELLNELIRQKPANVGVALRDWVSAGPGASANSTKN